MAKLPIFSFCKAAFFSAVSFFCSASVFCSTPPLEPALASAQSSLAPAAVKAASSPWSFFAMFVQHTVSTGAAASLGSAPLTMPADAAGFFTEIERHLSSLTTSMLYAGGWLPPEDDGGKRRTAPVSLRT